jgi:dephospho-CoA kinase
MRIIGLTGGIASGKSTVSKILRSLGAVIIDADIVARRIMEPGQDTLELVVEEFGRSILKDDGTLDRKLLGSIVFNNKGRLDKLNSITHPEIRRMIEKQLEIITDSGREGIVVIDAAVLIESGMDNIVDEVWLVYIDFNTQVKRLVERDSITLPEAEARIRSQLPVEEKIKKSHRIIDNTGGLDSTREQVKDLWDEFTR